MSDDISKEHDETTATMIGHLLIRDAVTGVVLVDKRAQLTNKPLGIDEQDVDEDEY